MSLRNQVGPLLLLLGPSMTTRAPDEAAPTDQVNDLFRNCSRSKVAACRTAEGTDSSVIN